MDVKILCKLYPSSSSVSFGWEACGLFVPWSGIEPALPAVEGWNLDHWATREVLGCSSIGRFSSTSGQWNEHRSARSFPCYYPAQLPLLSSFWSNPLTYWDLFGFSTHISIFHLPLAVISVGSEAQNDWLVLNVFSSSHTDCWHCFKLVCVYVCVCVYGVCMYFF